jgi:hypothetical protein
MIDLFSKNPDFSSQNYRNSNKMTSKKKTQDDIDREVNDWMDDVFSYVDNEENKSQETAITIEPSQLISKMIETSKAVEGEKLRSKKK